MNTVVFLLCVLTRQITGQANDIYPAKIYTPQKRISEGNDLYFTCSTFGSKKQSRVFVYLCKDGVGMEVLEQEKEKNDTPFKIPGVGHGDRGNYSCIYSETESKPSALRETVATRIEIEIIPSFLPADISVVGPSAVTEGDSVRLRCTCNNLQTVSGCKLIQSYLRRKETIIQVQAFNVTRMEALFTIEGAAIRDSGSYSCVLLPSKCISEKKEAFFGNNLVLIEVKGSWLFQVMFFCGIICLILSLGFCLWMASTKYDQMNTENRKDKGKSHVLYTINAAEPETHAFEEQQEQGEGLESQDSGSFSEDEEEEDYQNDADSKDSHYNEEDGVYSAIVDPPSAVSTYATSFKKKMRRAPDFSCSQKLV